MNVFEKPSLFLFLALPVFLLSINFFQASYNAKSESISIHSYEVVQIRCADHALRIRFRDIESPYLHVMPEKRCQDISSRITQGSVVKVSQIGSLILGIKSGNFVAIDTEEKLISHDQSMKGFGIFLLFISIIFFLFGFYLKRKNRLR